MEALACDDPCCSHASHARARTAGSPMSAPLAPPSVTMPVRARAPVPVPLSLVNDNDTPQRRRPFFLVHRAACVVVASRVSPRDKPPAQPVECHASVPDAVMAPTLQQRVHDLSDIQLALLLSLTTREHPILTTPAPHIDSLTRDLASIASATFHLTHAVVNCTPSTTLDDFTSALLIPSASASPSRLQDEDERPSSSSARPDQIANCILAPNLNLAPRAVQLRTLELLRTKRIFTHTSVQKTPPRFLFIPILPADAPGRASPALTPHLNDVFALAHWHDPLDGHGIDAGQAHPQHQHDDETSSPSSVVRRRDGELVSSSPAFISDEDIHHLALLSQQVQLDVDVLRYQMNIVSFLRVHYAVQNGVTPAATRHFGKLMRCLASMHSLDYVTPALVALAAKKTYLHRIRITTPENERSMQWGSHLDAVAARLNDVGPEDVIDDVLNTVTAPI